MTESNKEVAKLDESIKSLTTEIDKNKTALAEVKLESKELKGQVEVVDVELETLKVATVKLLQEMELAKEALVGRLVQKVNFKSFYNLFDFMKELNTDEEKRNETCSFQSKKDLNDQLEDTNQSDKNVDSTFNQPLASMLVNTQQLLMLLEKLTILFNSYNEENMKNNKKNYTQEINDEHKPSSERLTQLEVKLIETVKAALNQLKL